MSGSWTTQNKILPGAYINFKTNAPLSITLGDRGTVVLLQEVSVGTKGEVYRVTAIENEYPVGVTATDKKLVNEALKGAKTVLLYNLGKTAHTPEDIETALGSLRTVKFNVIAYPYEKTTYDANKTTIETWVKAMRKDEGLKIQGVMANQIADDEGIINVAQGIMLADGSTLPEREVVAWVAGQTAGANINKSNTGQKYLGAIDVVPRMTKTQMETAITEGKFIFKVDTAQNVTAVYDINSLTTITVDKGKQLTKNRVIRVIDSINNDVTEIFESNYVGKANNNTDGRSLLRATLIEYFNELQRLNAIQNFTAEDISVNKGVDSDAVVIDCFIQPVDSIEKIYISVNLS